MDYFNWKRFEEAWGEVLPYLHVTFEFLFVALIFSTLGALIVAVVRTKKIPVLNQIFGVYISYMRGVPMLVQLMVVYYGMPVMVRDLTGIDIVRWNGMFFAYIAVVLNESAFLGESFRGAIEAVPAIQTEAGYSIGMTGFQTFTRIVLPQAIKTIIPTYGTTIVELLQSTSMLYTIGIIDIMARAKSIAAMTGHIFEGYAVCAVIYVVCSLIIKLIFNIIDRKYNFGKGVVSNVT